MCALVTGVQTCALPISAVRHAAGRALAGGRRAPWRRYDAGGRLQRPRMNTAQIKPDGTVLGFDVGARRIGVAVGSAFGHGARALAVIDVHGDHIDWQAIDRLHAEWRPDGLVVGDPMTPGGGAQPVRRSEEHTAELQSLMRISYAV